LLAAVLIFAGVTFYVYLNNNPLTYPAFTIGSIVGIPDLFNPKQKFWQDASRGGLLQHGSVLKTGEGNEVDFHIPGQIRVRLKENSELAIRGANLFQEGEDFVLDLKQGTLLLCSEKTFENKRFLITSSILDVQAGGVTALRAELISDAKGTSENVGILKGKAEVHSRSFLQKDSTWLKQLEWVKARKGWPLGPAMEVTREEWGKMKEAYELCEARTETAQMDLSKRAGTLFKYIFDHGTFYTPRAGYARREFFEDPETGEVLLELEYDVFPTGSFVGMYTKARNFDLSKFKALEFEVRSVPGEGVPENFRIEMKGKEGMVKVFTPFQFKPTWQKVQLPLHFEEEVSVEEVTIVFTNEKVGEKKKGILQFKNFDVVPFEPEKGNLKLA
jgi:hypothetical protein